MEKLKNMPAGGGADANLLNDYLKRLEKCEKKAEKAEDKAEKGLKKIKKWKPQWKQMQKDIDELKKRLLSKTDQALFDEEIDRLKDLINQLVNSGKDIKAPIVTGPSLSAKEIADMREAIKKVWEHEKRLEGFDLDKILKSIERNAKDI